MPATAGLALAIAFSLIAYARSRQPASSYYASEVYGMTPAAHRRYAFVFLGFAAAFGASYALPEIPVTLLFGGYVLVMVFYAASFARGFGE